MHDRDRAHAALVAQIRKVLGQLHRGEHALETPSFGWTAKESTRRPARPVCAAERPGGRGRCRGAAAVDSRCGDEQHRHVGHTCQGGDTTSAPSGSTGTGRQPSTSRPSSIAIASIRAIDSLMAGDRVGGQEAIPAAKAFEPSGPGSGSSKSTTSRSSSTGSCNRIPAPSPLLGSAPAAPRCSRCSRAVRPSATIACERRPWISATIARHGSDSRAGSYKPCAWEVPKTASPRSSEIPACGAELVWARCPQMWPCRSLDR